VRRSIEIETVSSGLSTISKALINDNNFQIASAATQQTTCADDIARNTCDIQDMAASVANYAQETSEANNELATVASQLKEAVSRFHIWRFCHPARKKINTTSESSYVQSYRFTFIYIKM
jgi:methyl-accepting chemotaxis protein